MAQVTLPFYVGLLSADPGTLSPLGTFEQRHLGYGIADDGSLPFGVTITNLQVRVCRSKHATHGESVLSPPDYAVLMIPSGHTIPASNDAAPPSDGGWVADWAWEAGSQAPADVALCDVRPYLYPVFDQISFTLDLINPVTGQIYTTTDLFAAQYGVVFIAQNNSGFFSVTFSELRITEMALVVTYDEGSGLPPPDDSTPCCGSGPDPDNPDPSSTPNPGDPSIPLQPWTPQCAGGGTVPFAADVTDAESWAL